MALASSPTDGMSVDEDAALMLRVRSGDAVAFEQLMRRYQTRVKTVLRHVVGHDHLAEDLTQDVFLRVYRARHRYEPRAKFSTWLFTITNNVASNALRSLSRRKEVQTAAPGGRESAALSIEELAKAASGMMPARRMDKAELGEIVRLAIETLGERQRMAVLLSKYEEMSYVDIAAAMELSPQAVKSLIARARANLKTVLAPYLESGAAPGELAGVAAFDSVAAADAGAAAEHETETPSP